MRRDASHACARVPRGAADPHRSAELLTSLTALVLGRVGTLSVCLSVFQSDVLVRFCPLSVGCQDTASRATRGTPSQPRRCLSLGSSHRSDISLPSRIATSRIAHHHVAMRLAR